MTLEWITFKILPMLLDTDDGAVEETKPASDNGAVRRIDHVEFAKRYKAAVATGMTTTELAESLGIARATILQRIKTIRKNAKIDLREKFGSLPRYRLDWRRIAREIDRL